MYTYRSIRQIPAPSSHVQQRKAGRSRHAPVVCSLCPYRTLGLAENADEKEIKKAYRQLALQHHPDVSKTEDSARRFISIQEAYNILTGKARGKEASSNRSDSNQWDFHDWFWQFRMSRSWERQRSSSPIPNAGSGAFQPQESKEGIRTQLAGLRHRAAIRRMQECNVTSSSPTEASAQPPASDSSTTQEPAVAPEFTEAAEVSDGANYTTPQADTEPSCHHQKPKFHMGHERRSHLSSQIAGLKRKGMLKQQLSN